MQQENTQVVGVESEQVVAANSPEIHAQPQPLDLKQLRQVSGGVIAPATTLGPHGTW